MTVAVASPLGLSAGVSTQLLPTFAMASDGDTAAPAAAEEAATAAAAPTAEPAAATAAAAAAAAAGDADGSAATSAAASAAPTFTDAARDGDVDDEGDSTLPRVLIVGDVGGMDNGVFSTAAGLSIGRVAVRLMLWDDERTGPRATFLESLPSDEVDLMYGDVLRPDSIKSAVTGVSRVFLGCGGDDFEEREAALIDAAVATRGAEVTDAAAGAVGAGAGTADAGADAADAADSGAATSAAKAVGVQHIIKVSTVSAAVSEDSPVAAGQAQHRLEQKIKDSGIAYTILRPNMALQMLIPFFAPLIQAAGVVASPIAEDGAATAFIDARDVAHAAGHLLVCEEAMLAPHVNKTYDLTGAEAVTMGELVAKLSAALGGLRLAYIQASDDAFKTSLEKAQIAASSIDDLVAVAHLIGEGKCAEVSTGIKDVLGHSPRGVDEFLEEHRVYFGTDAKVTRGPDPPPPPPAGVVVTEADDDEGGDAAAGDGGDAADTAPGSSS